ncbi:hypothetical protein TNCV_4442481 [Trichonephila clavipes]|nr:hypothetical protein TNCV_4442481 [Trichonephila clavipes]
MSLQSSELSPLRDILVSTYSSCCKSSSVSSVILEKNFLEFDLKCITNHKLRNNSSYCGIVWNQECCVVFCLDNQNQSVCSYFKPNIPLNDFPIFVFKDRVSNYF